MAEVIWRSIIRFDKALTQEMWDEVHEMLKIPLAFQVAARSLDAKSLRRYRQMPEYQNHPADTFLFVGIPIDK
jgi:hypothetical protein